MWDVSLSLTLFAWYELETFTTESVYSCFIPPLLNILRDTWCPIHRGNFHAKHPQEERHERRNERIWWSDSIAVATAPRKRKLRFSVCLWQWLAILHPKLGYIWQGPVKMQSYAISFFPTSGFNMVRPSSGFNMLRPSGKRSRLTLQICWKLSCVDQHGPTEFRTGLTELLTEFFQGDRLSFVPSPESWDRGAHPQRGSRSAPDRWQGRLSRNTVAQELQPRGCSFMMFYVFLCYV